MVVRVELAEGFAGGDVEDVAVWGGGGGGGWTGKGEVWEELAQEDEGDEGVDGVCGENVEVWYFGEALGPGGFVGWGRWVGEGCCCGCCGGGGGGGVGMVREFDEPGSGGGGWVLELEAFDPAADARGVFVVSMRGIVVAK